MPLSETCHYCEIATIHERAANWNPTPTRSLPREGNLRITGITFSMRHPDAICQGECED